ncbi:MAG: hypothetical protein IKR41_03705 [Bacteroidales bacterium]|nr:hypothetical protein [Bacteroidales bacterium]
MRRLRFLGLLILTGLLTLQSCSKDNETTVEPQPNNDEVTPETPQTTTSKLSKVNIGDAKFIVKANSNNLKKKSLQKSDKIEKEIEDSFFKITESGNVEPIVFTKEDGSDADFHINDVQIINSDYVYINGWYDGTSSFLVNKKSEKIYGIPLLEGSNEYKFIESGNIIWVYPTNQGYCKINTNDFTIQEYSIDGYVYDLKLNKDGIAFYNSSVGWKVKHPSGKICLMKDIIDNFWYNTTEITNGNQDRFVLNTDGNFYDFHITGKFEDEDGFPSHRIDYITVNRMDINGNSIEKKELTKNTVKWNNFNNSFGQIKGIALNHISNSVLFFVDYDLYDNETNTNNCYEYNATTNEWNSYHIDIEGLSSDFYQSSSYLFFVSTDRQKLYRLDLVNNYQTKCIDMSGYEIYDIATSLASDDLSFTALRYEDGKNIAGVLNKAGDIESIVEKDSNTKLENIFQLN